MPKKFIIIIIIFLIISSAFAFYIIYNKQNNQPQNTQQQRVEIETFYEEKPNENGLGIDTTGVVTNYTKGSNEIEIEVKDKGKFIVIVNDETEYWVANMYNKPLEKESNYFPPKDFKVLDILMNKSTISLTARNKEGNKIVAKTFYLIKL